MGQNKAKVSRILPKSLWVALFLGLFLRVVFICQNTGHPYDANTFMAWALRLADVGPSAFYSPDYFADYPPGYLWFLWVAGKMIRFLGLSYSSAAARLLLMAGPIAADLALAVLAWRFSRQVLGERGARFLGILVTFCPMLWYNSGVWQQVDSLLTLFLVAAFWAAAKGKGPAAGLWYAAALLVKPQALIFGPVYALCFLLPFFSKKQARRIALLTAAKAFLCCAAFFLVVSAPFTGSQMPVVWLVRLYQNTASSYPYACLNACNLFGLLGKNWVGLDDTFLGLSLSVWGWAGIVLCGGLLLYFAIKSWKNDCFDPFLLASFFASGVFTLGHAIHEQDLFVPAVLLLLAFARTADRRFLVLAGGETAICFANMALAMANMGADEFLKSEQSVFLLRLFSTLQVGLFLGLAWVCWSFVKGKHSLVRQFGFYPAPQPENIVPTPFSRTEWGALALVTLAACLLNIWHLGAVKVPQSYCATQQEKLVLQVFFEQPVQVSTIAYYPGIGIGEIAVSDASQIIKGQLSVYTVFCWQKSQGAALSAGPENPLMVTLSENITVNELCFYNPQGEQVFPSGWSTQGSALFDEQQLAQPASCYNSMYFDEIYHARTAYELLHGLTPYETTHPPLGKELIAVGIALFGMCPFGWRIMGALFGALTVPIFYLLARQLMRKRYAAFATALFLLEPMRLVTSRIGSVDIFLVFFLLLSACFMAAGCRRLVWYGPAAAASWLAGAGIGFGLACSCKWNGLYAGAALAVWYFWAFFRRCKNGPQQAVQRAFKRELAGFLGQGFLFFVIVPVLLYALSYLPWAVRQPGFGLAGLWQCQLDMFSYHSTLTATHPFQSMWYSWLFNWRPVWYYMGTGLKQGQYASIALLGGPLLMWGGLAAVAWLGAKAVRGRLESAGWFVLLFWVFQLLPWALVSRAAFLYHYFPCVPFLALAAGLFMQAAGRKKAVLSGRLCMGLTVLAAVQLCFFFPALTGIAVGKGWASAMLLLPSWGFYIL